MALLGRRRNRIRRTIAAAIGSGIIFAPGAFIFQIVESWIASYSDTRLPKGTLVWLVPALATISYMLAVALTFSLVARHRSDRPSDPSATFREAVIDYATTLNKVKRDSALLELQEGIAWVFHSQSANEERVRLGTMALDAALRQHDTERQIAILVDDLGWASHMAGHDALALKNIDRAIEILGALPAGQLTGNLQLKRAKAYRHRAIIESPKSLDAARRDLASAEEDVVAALPEGNGREIELGQLRHAEALCLCASFGLLDGGRVRPDNPEAVEQAQKALDLTRDAEEKFRLPGQWQFTRYTKALYLEHALLVCLGRELEARETKTILDDAFGKSSWEIDTLQSNFRGV